MRTAIIAAIALLFFCSHANAHEYASNNLSIHHPYAYEVKKLGNMTWAFMHITNNGEEDDKLIGASSPIAGSIDIMDGDTKVDEVDIDSNRSVKLKHNGIHLVLNDIKKTPIRVGARRTITLKFERAGDVKVDLIFGKIAEVSLCDDGSHSKKIKPKD